MAATFRSGDGETTKVGYINRNNQQNHGTLGIAGNDHEQYAYRLECLDCRYVYGANGADIFQRKCPQCAEGEPAIPYWLVVKQAR